MIKLEHPLLTTKHTEIFIDADEDKAFGAVNYFEVHAANDASTRSHPLAQILFQLGPIKEYGINGVHNEDLLIMVLCRLESFQETEYKCKENEMAIIKLEEALLWLRKRTTARERRGIEGTSVV